MTAWYHEGSSGEIKHARRETMLNIHCKGRMQGERVSSATLLRLPSHAARLPATLLQRPVLQPAAPAAGPLSQQPCSAGTAVLPIAGSSAPAPFPCSCTGIDDALTYVCAASTKRRTFQIPGDCVSPTAVLHSRQVTIMMQQKRRKRTCASLETAHSQSGHQAPAA